ncbi:EamA family transporter [Sphingobacterium pedocola]|uniref:EamA family transporter n=1 Tax=Sphingobacterium pedocola TaxID=2082722 RepID=A0ABR9T1S2_9SPHI|nr:DMT family transporter [Sphingobacterium pedocola]MBE8719245.1 EamA family transporter [Sphingobacterium pedocola]
MEQIKGAIAVFLGAASFGILSTFVKKAYANGFSLGEVTGVQAFFGMLFLWILYLITRLFSTEHKPYPKRTKYWKIIFAGFSTGVVSIFYYKCVSLAPASIAIVLLMQYIWISALINLVVFKQKTNRKEGIGIVFILLATLFATGVFQDTVADIDIIGVLYGLSAAVAYAIFIIVNSKVGNDYPPIQKSAYMVTGAFILITITLQPVSSLQSSLNASIVKYGLLLAFFGTVLPPVLFAYGMPKTGVSLGSILSAVELPVAVGMSFYVLHEQVTALQWAGVFAILGIVVWINWRRRGVAN